MDEDGRKLGSKWVTDSEVLCTVPCDLLQVLVTHTTGTSNWKVYDGEDTGGDVTLDMKTEYSKSFIFPGGLHMKKGIYFYADTKVQGALIRWRVSPPAEG